MADNQWLALFSTIGSSTTRSYHIAEIISDCHFGAFEIVFLVEGIVVTAAYMDTFATDTIRVELHDHSLL